MADHIDDPAVAAIPAMTYADLRPTLQSGDLLFCSGNYLVSKLIRKFTKSPWSHIGIVLWATQINRVLLLESVEDVGVRLAPLSKYVLDYENGEPYDGALVIARIGALTSQILVGSASFGADQLTRPYDKDEIGRIVARIALGIKQTMQDQGEYICSELVHACFQAGGIVLNTSGEGFVSPEDIWRDGRVTPVARFTTA
jgi:cell wall-associated NlpC family hydrolase